jgi:hypothetical protein
MPDNEYTITQINEMSVLDAAGNPVQGFRVWFDFGEGQTGHIDLPLKIASPERREAAIQTYIDRAVALWG